MTERKIGFQLKKEPQKPQSCIVTAAGDLEGFQEQLREALALQRKSDSSPKQESDVNGLLALIDELALITASAEALGLSPDQILMHTGTDETILTPEGEKIKKAERQPIGFPHP